MEKIDEFLEKSRIELLPFQKEILRNAIHGKRIYIIHPPHMGRYYFQGLLYLISNLTKGE